MCGQESNQRLVFLLTCCSNLTVGFHGCVTAFFFFWHKKATTCKHSFLWGHREDEAMPFSVVPHCQYKRHWVQAGTEKVTSEHQEALLYHVDNWALAQVAHTGCGVSSLDTFKTHLDLTCFVWPCLIQGVGPGGLQKCLPTSAILWSSSINIWHGKWHGLAEKAEAWFSAFSIQGSYSGGLAVSVLSSAARGWGA